MLLYQNKRLQIGLTDMMRSVRHVNVAHAHPKYNYFLPFQRSQPYCTGILAEKQFMKYAEHMMDKLSGEELVMIVVPIPSLALSFILLSRFLLYSFLRRNG